MHRSKFVDENVSFPKMSLFTLISFTVWPLEGVEIDRYFEICLNQSAAQSSVLT